VALAVLLAIFGFMLWNVSGMWRDTPTLYTETLKRSPGATLIAANLGRYHFYRGDYKGAEEWFSRSLELWDKSFVKVAQRRAIAYAGLGSISYRRGDIGKAREFFMKAYQETPNDAAVLQNLGSVCVELGDYDGALKYYQAAIEQNPRSEITYSNRAAIYLTMKDYDNAIRDAQRALDIHPNYGDAYMNLARAFAGKGMKAQAIDAYRRAKQVDSSKSAIADADIQALESSPPEKK
jgi:tetratricopeptide (TPR) repeat protein